MARRRYEEIQKEEDFEKVVKEAGMMDRSMIIMENYALRQHHDCNNADVKRKFEEQIEAIRLVRDLMYSYVTIYDNMSKETGE